MSQGSISPINGVTEHRKDPYLRDDRSQQKPQKGIDSKVQKFAKTKIKGNSGSLFASATTPKVLPLTDSSAQQEKIDKPTSGPKKDEKEKEPIGFLPCDPDSWINAVMQIILQIPIFKTIFTVLAPQSYEPFRIFLDQYHKDQKAHRSVSSASGAQIVDCLKKNLPPEISERFGQPYLFGIFQSILLIADFVSPNSQAIHHIHQLYGQFEWDEKEFSLAHLIKNLVTAPCDLLISVKRKKESSNTIPTQIFDSRKNTYYDLHGFIEIRKEYGQLEFIAYLKINGKNWYQCRNQRVAKLCSTHLHQPLTSSHLLHYKKCHV